MTNLVILYFVNYKNYYDKNWNWNISTKKCRKAENKIWKNIKNEIV